MAHGEHRILESAALPLSTGRRCLLFAAVSLLQLMIFRIVIVPLPLAFIVPTRGDATLYLLLFGWAMIFAKLAVALITLIAKFSVFVANHFLAATGTTEGDAFRKVSARFFRIVPALLVA